MDYGHLRFGAFITPVNEQADLPCGSRSSPKAEYGLDLVTFQDHPYQPAFLDTWTLMSWVAAQTERIEIARRTSSTSRCAHASSRHVPRRASIGSRAGGSRSASGVRRLLEGDRGDGWTGPHAG